MAAHLQISASPVDKERLSDDSRRGGQNDWSSMAETIYIISLDIVPAMAFILAQRAKAFYGELPAWFHLQL